MEHYKQQRVAFENCTILEGIRCLFLEPRRPAGAYFPIDPSDSVDEPYGRYCDKTSASNY